MLEELYDSVVTFNQLANTSSKKKDIINQLKLIKEEVNELEEAITNNDAVKTLDGVIDILYVTLGELYKLESLGIDVEGAIQQVCDDNATKFPSSEQEAKDTVLYYENQGVKALYNFNKVYGRYVIKDSNQKVRKPINFIPTDLSDYVPDKLKKEGFV